MRKRKFIAILFFAVSFSACETISDSEDPKDYPAFIPELERATLNSLNEQYHSTNNGQICSPLNEYGFTGFSRILFPSDENPCLSRKETLVELPFSESILEIARQSLVFNSQFTGVENVSDLQIEEIISLDGCTICEGPDINNVPLQWKITFSSQKVNDIPVSGSSIAVYQDVNGVNRIWGNWYKDIVDPGFVIVGSKAAREKLIGERLRYRNEQNQILEQEIYEEHIDEKPQLFYQLIKRNDGAEIHKVWKLFVYQNGTKTKKWEINISTISGDILSVETI